MESNPFHDWDQLIKHTVAFHTLANGFELKADILLPPTLTPSPNHPLIIAYHGGGLVLGARDHYPYQAAWLPSWAAKNNAIIVSSDYRLLPQASAQDIIDDVHALWNWVRAILPSTLADLTPSHGIDLTRILVQGGSAGGFTAAHLSLSHPTDIRATILVYPMVDGLYRRGEAPEKPFLGQVLIPHEQMVAEIEAECASGRPTVSRMSFPGQPSYAATMLWNREAYAAAFGQGKGLQPIDRIGLEGENGSTGLPERVWILHGTEDTAVPCKYSHGFVEKLQQAGWDKKSQVVFTAVDDEPSPHGFDGTWKSTDQKLKKHLEWIEEVWLR